MVRAFQFAHWIALTALPALVWYLTDAGGAATRLDGAVNNLAPTASALLPFGAIMGLAASVLVLSFKAGPWFFGFMPQTFKLRYAFYRQRKVKDLYPALEKAICLDSARRLYMSGETAQHDFSSQLKLIAIKLAELGIDVDIHKLRSLSGEFVRDLAPLAEHGYYEQIRRICEPFLENRQESP